MAAKKSPNKAARRASQKRSTSNAASRPSSPKTEANRTRATQLYVAGNPPSAIAAQMGISERNVRRHVEQTRKDFAADHQAERDTMMVRAIESQRALAAAALAAYEEERDRELAILTGQHDYVKRRIVRRGRPRRDARPDDPDAWDPDSDYSGDLVEEIERPRLPSQRARFLAVAFNAHREAAKLQGLYNPQAQQTTGPKHILVTDDVDPETGEPIIVPVSAKYSPTDQPNDAPNDPDQPNNPDHTTALADPSAGMPAPANIGAPTSDKNIGEHENPATNGQPTDTFNGMHTPQPDHDPLNPQDTPKPATNGHISTSANPPQPSIPPPPASANPPSSPG